MPALRRPSSDAAVQAMAHLCELVRRHNARSFQQVVAFDWSAYPRLSRHGLEDLDPGSPELVRQAGRAVLEAAVAELAPRHPDPPDDVSPITVLRKHVLDGDTWEVVQAERDEQDLPRLSERTLKNRQREGYRLVLHWGAAGEDPGPAVERESRIRGRRLMVQGAAVLAALLILFVGVSRWSRPDLPRADRVARQLEAVPRAYRGTLLALPHQVADSGPRLLSLVPDLRLPDLGGTIRRAMLLPGEDGDPPRLLVGTGLDGDPAGVLALYDAVAETLLWRQVWRPPAEEVRTHATLDEDDLLEQEWFPMTMAWAEGGWDLGDRVLVVYAQRYSPVFAVLFDRHTGEERARYVHPGHLPYAFVGDVTGDGAADAVLLGTNNVVDRPTYVVLDPRMEGRAAASSVRWNQEGEGSLFRVLLPDLPAFRDEVLDARLWAEPVKDEVWNAADETLVVPVGAGARDAGGARLAYEARLRHGWQVLGDGESILVDDTVARLWEALGLAREKTRRQLEREIRVVRGTGFSAAVESHARAARLAAVDPRWLGVELGDDAVAGAGRPSWAELFPDLRLPDAGSPIRTVLLLPGEAGGPPGVLLGTGPAGTDAGALHLWDAAADTFVWTLRWRPPADEIETHPGVPAVAREEPWTVRYATWRSGPWDLADRVAVVYQQRWSPTFVLFVDRRTGAPLHHYAHPGHLGPPVVLDLCGEGRAEVILSGTDNALDQAVLVALDPTTDADGAASTVQWNHAGEAALFRVLLPDLPAWMEAEGIYRQHAAVVRLADWSVKDRILVLSVGTSDPGRCAYMAYLRDGWQVLPDRTINVSDAMELQWKRLGLDQAATRRSLEKGIRVVRGTCFQEFLAAGGPSAAGPAGR
jgi:hypothetical protein